MADVETQLELIADVIVDQKVPLVLSYSVPKELEAEAFIGRRCEVLLRNQKVKGVILKLHKNPPRGILKSLLDISRQHQIPEGLLNLALWMSHYYITPVTKVLSLFLPKLIKEKGLHEKPSHALIQIEETLAYLSANHPRKKKAIHSLETLQSPLPIAYVKKQLGTPLFKELEEKKLIELVYLPKELESFDRLPAPIKTLTDEQKKASLDLKRALIEAPTSVHLLYGVCGSGKTEVYMELIEEALKQKKGIIYLVPEVSLAPQTYKRLQARFHVPIALYHHQISLGLKKREWEGLNRGDIPIVLGARSALFAPIKNLGLIIIDEEHEGAYKQEGMPTYHTRDVALMRGKIDKAMIVLGSATPSIETYHLAKKGKITLHTLLNRPSGATLPEILLSPLGSEFQKAQGFHLFGETALKALSENLKKGEQSLVFMNRRGYHAQQTCTVCAEAIKCSGCSIPMTFHKRENELQCHFCGFHQKSLEHCPLCGGETMRFKGFGTQSVEARLQMAFKEARIMRIDKDTTREKGSLESLFDTFSAQGSDILIGTQMIAKGLDFSHLTLAIILNIDSHLNRPDFRAHEEAFQLMTQVAGRAGRSALKGRVIIQTMNPEHPLCLLAQQQDYPAFFDKEIKDREMFDYPPFSRLIRFIFACPDEKILEAYSSSFRQKLIGSVTEDYTVEPVVPCFHEKIEHHFRMQLLIRGKTPLKFFLIIQKIDEQLKIPSTLRRLIDVDPLSTFF